MFRSYILFLVFCCLALRTYAAETNIEPRYEAMARLQLKDPEGACRVLDAHYPETIVDENIWLLRARCNAQLKNYDRAIANYTRLVNTRPDMMAPRMELAQLYRTNGQYSAAQDVYRDILSSHPSQTITQRLEDAIDALGRMKNWYARVETGVIFDSNINSGPQNDQIVVYDTPFTLSSSARQENAFGMMIAADAGYTYKTSPNTAVVAQISAGRSDYFSGSDFDINTAQIGIGPMVRFGKFRTILQPNLSWQSLGDETYRTGLGATNRTIYSLNDHVDLGVSLLAQQANYMTISGRDSTLLLASPDVAYSWNRRTKLSGGLIARRENADNDIYSNNAVGGRVNGVAPIGELWRASGSYQYLSSVYDGAQPAFDNRRRNDAQHFASLRLDRDLSDEFGNNLTLGFRYQYIDNRSNLDAYHFDRHIGIISVSKTW